MVYLILGNMFNYHFLKFVSIQVLSTSRGNKTTQSLKQSIQSLEIVIKVQDNHN